MIHESRLGDLYVAQQKPLFRVLRRMTRNSHDAEDLVQDAFLRVWKNRASFEGRGALGGYLRTTAVRLFQNSIQGKAGRPRTGSVRFPLNSSVCGTHACPYTELAHQDSRRYLLDRLELVLGELPMVQRQAYSMYRAGGRTMAEIAALAGVRPKTVETRIRRATLRVADQLGAYRDHWSPK